VRRQSAHNQYPPEEGQSVRFSVQAAQIKDQAGFGSKLATEEGRLPHPDPKQHGFDCPDSAEEPQLPQPYRGSPTALQQEKCHSQRICARAHHVHLLLDQETALLWVESVLPPGWQFGL
jgi:hypothetical protein